MIPGEAGAPSFWKCIHTPVRGTCSSPGSSFSKIPAYVSPVCRPSEMDDPMSWQLHHAARYRKIEAHVSADPLFSHTHSSETAENRTHVYVQFFTQNGFRNNGLKQHSWNILYSDPDTKTIKAVQPKLRWLSSVQNDPEILEINYCRRKALEMGFWKGFLEEAKTQNGF
jgi:hypothetical protein